MRKTEQDTIIQKNDIIATAYKCFSKKGYAATKMEDISRELGISRTPLYYHFNNKEVLFLSVIEYYYKIAIERHKRNFGGTNSIFEKISLDLRSCYQDKTILLENLLDDIERLEKKNSTVREVHQKYVVESYKIKSAAVKHAVENGELRQDIDVDQFVTLIFSVYYCLISSSTQSLLNMAKINVETIIDLYVDMMRNTYKNSALNNQQ